MSRSTLVTQKVQLKEWFHMMQESKGRPEQVSLDEWCRENYGISAAGYYYRVKKVKEAYLDQIPEQELQDHLAMVPKNLYQEKEADPEKEEKKSSFLDIFQNDLCIRIYEDTDEQLLLRVLRSLGNAK